MQQAEQGIIDPTKKRKKRKLKKEKRKKERKQTEKRRKMENKDACEKDDSDDTLILSAEEFEPTLQSGTQGPLKRSPRRDGILFGEHTDKYCW